MTFKIDERLLSDGPVIYKLALCEVILVNNRLFPWLILVPHIDKLSEVIDLNQENQMKLMSEICLISKIMQELFNPDKLNIAALGNIVSQLHIHIVARFANDTVFPKPVFGGPKENYDAKELHNIISMITDKLNNLQNE